MSKYDSPIDVFAEHPEMVPLLDIADEWHELFEREEYDSAAQKVAELHVRAMELLSSDVKEARRWGARAMGVAGLARASINLGGGDV